MSKQRLRGFLALIAATLMVSGSGLMISSAAATGGTTPIEAKALTDHECDSSESHFVITQVEPESNAPATITVNWANGATEVVSLGKYTGKTAHYTTTSNLDSMVTSATANIYQGWQGEFRYSHGPCGGGEEPPPPTSVTPEKPSATQPNCENPNMTVTPSSQPGVIWTPSGVTVLEPGETVTYVATPGANTTFPPNSQTSWPFTNTFDPSKECEEEPPPPNDECPPLTGSVKTTLPDGSVVNGNIYTNKSDVYISGDQLGDVTTVYVRVTDPSGSVVLSATKTVAVTDGSFGPVQLPAFNDSPNNGDEYKVWVSSTTDFESKCTKFDNFKVRGEEPPPPTPANPTVSAAAKACVNKGEATGVVDVTVNNTDDATDDEVLYEVTLNGVTKQVTIADGQSAVVQFTGLAAGDYAVTVKGDDKTTASTPVKVEECKVTSTPTPTPTETPTTPTETPTTPTDDPTPTTPTETPTPEIGTPTSTSVPTPTSTPTFVPPSTGGGEWPPSNFGSSDYSFASMMGKLMLLGGFALFLVLGFERWGRRKVDVTA